MFLKKMVHHQLILNFLKLDDSDFAVHLIIKGINLINQIKENYLSISELVYTPVTQNVKDANKVKVLSFASYSAN